MYVTYFGEHNESESCLQRRKYRITTRLTWWMRRSRRRRQQHWIDRWLAVRTCGAVTTLVFLRSFHALPFTFSIVYFASFLSGLCLCLSRSFDGRWSAFCASQAHRSLWMALACLSDFSVATSAWHEPALTGPWQGLDRALTGGEVELLANAHECERRWGQNLQSHVTSRSWNCVQKYFLKIVYYFSLILHVIVWTLRSKRCAWYSQGVVENPTGNGVLQSAQIDRASSQRCWHASGVHWSR